MIAAALFERGIPEFGVWSENVLPMTVLIAMRRQLRRSGQFGRIDGLDYSVLPYVMDRVGVPEAEVNTVFERLQEAEDELLEALNET